MSICELLDCSRLLEVKGDLLLLRVEHEFAVLVLREEAELQVVLLEVDCSDEECVNLRIPSGERAVMETICFALVGWNETDNRLILWMLNGPFAPHPHGNEERDESDDWEEADDHSENEENML